MDVLAFQRKWIDASRQKERSAYVTHFNDLCDVLRVPKPLDADPTGEEYGFEKGAEIAGGGGGWADVWYNRHFAWEYKGRGKDLDAAYVQLLRYKDDLGNPPLLVVSDLNIIRIHTNFTNTVKRTYEVDLVSISEPGKLALLRRLWSDPESLRPGTGPKEVTEEAAARFSKIALGLHQRGEDPAASAHFIMQLVFCLFAEDIHLLPDRLFSQMIAADRNDPAQFQTDARELLEAMNSGGRVAYKRIPHINGGLFATVDVPRLTADEIALLHETAALDWSSIEPAIFGTLFERSLDPAKRSQLGAHYTGLEDIERVVEPVVMTPLRRRWDEVRAEATKLLQKRKGTTLTPAQGRKFNGLIDGFLAEIRAVRVLDPACGSGNFLYVALKHLLTLEKEVLTWRATNAAVPLGFPFVHPSQVMGIEINEYAQELAQVAIWIGYIQWRIDNGFGWNEPVLAPLENIRLQDALLTFHDDGTVTETEWPEADFIIGNPPFLGDKKMRGELGDGYTARLWKTYDGSIPGGADLVCYFFEKARQQIEQDEANRAGLLATNSIRGGANRRVLDRIKSSGEIFLAWNDEPWILDGAAVRISIVGFDNGTEDTRLLDGQTVANINSDLTGQTDITIASSLRENEDLSFIGDQKGGPFDISHDVALAMLSEPVNPNGRPNSDVVRSWINGLDIARRPRQMWIIDFGNSMPLETAAMYEAPFRYIEQTVKPKRIGNREARTGSAWWIHQRARSEMRNSINGLGRYLCTPRLARHRLFVWQKPQVLPDSQIVVFSREDDYFFGVLHSRAHEVWSLRMGTWLGKGNDPRYTPTTCFETFPFPWPPGTEPVDDPRVIAIGEAAKELDRLRENWLNPEGATEAELKKRTLTNLYNQRPTWLQHAHAALDRAVWDAYGRPPVETPSTKMTG
jgi:type II restriction/modification system DNA methylase subunit YeeA